MSGRERDEGQRLQAIMTALLRRRISDSLDDAWAALSRWRAEELGVFETHSELLKHAARAEQLAERMARASQGLAGSLLREAFDEGLVGREEFVELVGRSPEEVERLPPVDVEADRGAPPDKREVVEKLLADGPILVHIDARRDDISVPGGLRRDPKLVLRFGYGLTPAIVDLSIDADGIAGTLTFGGIPHRCVMPWPAVYAVVSEVDQRGMVWPDDVPAAVVEQLTPSEGAGDDIAEHAKADSPPARAARNHLKLVK